MSKHQISTRTLALIVLGSAVGFGAMASATPLWASGIRDLVIFIQAVAIGGAIFDRGPRRAFWAGLAIVGSCNFPTISVLLSSRDGLASQGADRLAVLLHPYAESSMMPAGTSDEVISFDVVRKIYHTDPGAKATNARRILGDLFGLLYGIAGGLTVRAIYLSGEARRSKGPDPGTDRHRTA